MYHYHDMNYNPYMDWYWYNQPAVYDYGGRPFVVDIESAATANQNYRTTIWTGEYLQITLMSIPVGGDVGLEVHPDTDQFLRIENGRGLVRMGERSDYLPYQQVVCKNDAIMVPAGKWHNLINTGRHPLKLYSIYAPPEHAYGAIHQTMQDAMNAEDH